MILCVHRLPKDEALVTKYVSVILTMNCVLECVLYCILWDAFVGQYTEVFFAVTLYGTLQVPQIYLIVCYLTYQWLCYILTCDLPILQLLSS